MYQPQQYGASKGNYVAKRFVDNYLLFQLAILSQKFSEEFHAQLREVGVTPSRWRILLNLSGIDGMYLTQLAEHTCYEQSRVTKSIDKLSAEGLVRRDVCGDDKRRVRVSITDAGEALLVPLVTAAKVYERKVLREIPKEDRTRLKQILATFVANHVAGITQFNT